MGYSQHQSFYLRDRWVSKAMKNIEQDNTIFFKKNAFEKVGLGKNMVQSLKHWITALKLYEEKKDGKVKYHSITPLGIFIQKHDRSIKYIDTAALLHHSLITNKEVSTSWYWFFNIFNETVFTRQELLEELTDWVQAREKKVIAESSIKRDVDCLLKLYTAGGSASDPEEVILSPLYKLNLIEEKNGYYYKKETDLDMKNLLSIGYTLLKYAEETGNREITIDDIVHQECLLGKAFNMSRSTIVNVIGNWTNHSEYPVVFTRTNNLDTVRLPNVTAIEFAEYEFNRK